MKCNLLVIRSGIPDKLAEFYTHLGLSFDYHRHGSGPNHYSADNEGFVLEIYPLSKSQARADPFVRLGFEVESLDKLLGKFPPDVIVQEAKLSVWGYRCVITDPEGRRVELVEVGSGDE